MERVSLFCSYFNKHAHFINSQVTIPHLRLHNSDSVTFFLPYFPASAIILLQQCPCVGFILGGGGQGSEYKKPP